MNTKMASGSPFTLLLLTIVALSLLAAGPVRAQSDDPALTYDLPGFGIWGPAYRLRNVPEGMRVVLRAGPSRQTETVASLSRSATEILVLACTPEIDPMTFEDGSPNAKRALLAAAWCRVNHYQVEGFLPGLYLDPILGR